jgi:Uma2 family endonuclease
MNIAAPQRLEIPEDRLYEVVNGVVQEKTVGTRQNLIATRVVELVIQFDPQREQGQSVVENLFVLDADADLQRRPDFAFVSRGRWPDLPPNTNAWQVIPDWAVEVNSPTNFGEAIIDKVDEYFAAGVRLVWVIYANARRVYVYTSPNEVAILNSQDEITAAPVLPGFRIKTAALFDGIVEPAESK